MAMTETEKKMNLNLTTSQGVQPLYQAALNRQLLTRAKKKLIFHQFGQSIPLPKGKGKTITWQRMSPLPPAMTPLVEGVTPVGNHINITEITATPTQHGDYLAFSDQFDYFTPNPPPVVLRKNEVLGRQAGETLDLLTQAVIASGTNVRYSGGKTARSSLTSTDVMTVDDLRKAILTLKNNNAEPFDDGFYVAIVHPNVGYDLQNDNKWIDVKTYQDKQNIYNGELGKLYGARIVESNSVEIFSGNNLYSLGKTLQIEKIDGTKIYVHETLTENDATALASRKVLAAGSVATVTSATAGENGKAYLTMSAALPALWGVDTVLYPGEGAADGKPVYPTYVFGKNAYGVLDPKTTLETIAKSAGSAGSADPLNQRSTVGWKAYHVAKILADEYMVRIESAASNL